MINFPKGKHVGELTVRETRLMRFLTEAPSLNIQSLADESRLRVYGVNGPISVSAGSQY